MSVLYFILAALIAEAGFTIIGHLSKRMRMRGLTNKSIIAMCGLSLPVWVGIYFALGGVGYFPWQYILCAIVWLGFSYGLIMGTPFSPGYQSTGEGMGFRFLIAAVFALVLDLVVFKASFSSNMVLSIALLLAGGVLFQVGRIKIELKKSALVKMKYKLGFAAAVAAAEVGAYALFKYGALMQDNVAAHIALFQIFLMASFLVAGTKIMLADRAQGYFSVGAAINLAVLIVVASFAGGVAVAGLPLIMIVLFTLVRAAAFTANDIRIGALKFSPLNAVATSLIVMGVVVATLI